MVIRIISAKEAVQQIRDLISLDPEVDISDIVICQALQDCSDDIRGLVLFKPEQLSALETLGENGRKLFRALRSYNEIPMVYGQFAFRPQQIEYLIDHIKTIAPVAA